jgi:hypothetical protein
MKAIRRVPSSRNRVDLPENLPDELRERMQKVAVGVLPFAFATTRVDLRVTEAGDVYVIEVNPNTTSKRRVSSREPPSAMASATMR